MKMIDKMDKVYGVLTDQERGKLAYACLVKGNELEQLRIAGTMQDQYFIGLPDGYRRMFIELSKVSMIYSIAYWRNVAGASTYLAGAMGLIQDPQGDYQHVHQLFIEAEVHILSLEQAFDEVCEAHGLDREVMRHMAGRQFYTVATPDLKPDDHVTAGYREMFESGLH
jgi:hypothetical protein